MNNSKTLQPHQIIASEEDEEDEGEPFATIKSEEDNL